MTPIDPPEFVSAVKPLLERCDTTGLAAMLKARWTGTQLVALLRDEHEDVRKIAALAFGLVGDKCLLHHLEPLLKDPDPITNQMAEHAMWNIWFRGGTQQANLELCRGSKALDKHEFDRAVRHFTRALQHDPGCSEAYNQRAHAHYLQEQFESSLEDCRQVIERMPCHFGAWAGMGHCYAHEGRLAEAIRCYRKALDINPHMDGVRPMLEELEARRSKNDPTTL